MERGIQAASSQQTALLVVDSWFAMYCPVCGVEYRPNFTVCSDCQVALVPDPPNKSSEDAPAGDASFVLVWSGADPRKHAEVCESLDREKIPQRTVHREDRLVYATMHAAFEVYVPAALRPKANAVLNATILGQEEEERAAESGILEIPAEDDYPDDGDGNRRDGTDWQREDATVEIWSGKDSDMSGMITASLRENQIPCRTSADEADPAGEMEETGPDETAPDEKAPEEKTIAVFVLPEDEARAKEIVREIVDAAPPESGGK